MIRPIEMADAESLFDLVNSNRQYLRKWLPWLDYNQTVSDTKFFINGCLDRLAKKQSYENVIIDNGIICGICGFNKIDQANRYAIVGYWLTESFQKKGLVTQACRELEKIGFLDMKLNKIEIHVAEKNFASRAIPERLSYKQTGVLRDQEWLYDHFVDQVVYSKLAKEFLVI